MKRILLIASVTLLSLVSCRQEDLPVVEDERIYSSSSAALNGGDRVAVFSGPVREEYRVIGKRPDGSGILSRYSQKSYGSGTYHRYFAVYPYSTGCNSQIEGKVNVEFAKNSIYSKDAAVVSMQAASSVSLQDALLQFHPVGSVLKVRVRGNDAVSSISVSADGDEIISGSAVLTFAGVEAPTLAMSSIGSSEVTMECGGLALDDEEYTVFQFLLPPVTLSKGLSVDILNIDGKCFTYEFPTPVTLPAGGSHTVDIDGMSHGTGHALLSLTVALPDGRLCDAVDVLGKDITLCVPRGTDVRALKPKFKHNGAAVYVGGKVQKSGKSAVDFSSGKVVYEVVSSEGEKGTYTVRLLDVDLPVVFACTPDHKAIADRENWIEQSRFVILDYDWNYVDYGPTSFKGRGNSSWSYSKKPYAVKIETRPQKQDPAIETVLGMPGHKRWCLLSNCMGYNYGNILGYEVGRRSAIGWNPHARYVELVLNGVHKGLYLLVEQVKIDKCRIDIKEMDAEDITEKKITGGYLLNFDSTMDETWQFRSSHFNMPVMIKSPDEDVIQQSQFSYIKTYISDLEKSLMDASRFQARDYLNYLDVDSFIGLWMTKELASRKSNGTGRTTDFIVPRSVFYYKDRGGVLKAGPGWDFDVHFLCHQEALFCTECQYYKQLFTDKEFVRRVTELWPEFKSNLLDGTRYTPITQYVDSLYNSCAYAAKRDGAMWKGKWGSYPWYDNETQKKMVNDLLVKRIAFMDAEIAKMKNSL